jgi:hypothetical protein
MWVVGTSLLDLKEEGDKIVAPSDKGQTNEGSKGFPPSILNKTFYMDSDVEADSVVDLMEQMSHGQHDVARDSSIIQGDYHHLVQNAQQTGESLNNSENREHQVLARAWKSVRQLSSSDAATEKHWGTAILLILLWWGPALSLLCIPPRKDSFSADNYVSLDQSDGADEINFDESRNEGGETEQETFLNDAPSNPKPMSLEKGGEVLAESIELNRKEFTLIEMLKTGEAWLAAWTFLILVGGGTLMTCNIGKKWIMSRT